MPVRKVEEAIQRQVIYSGSLDTNLLEMGVIPEDQLLLHLSRATGLPPADYRWIRQTNAEALKLFPRKLAERYQLIPVEIRGGALLCLVAGTPDPSVLEELSFMLSLELKLHVLPEIRFLQAMEARFETSLRPRYRNLLRKLDGGQAQPGSELRSVSEEMGIAQIEAAITATRRGQIARERYESSAVIKALAAGITDPSLTPQVVPKEQAPPPPEHPAAPPTPATQAGPVRQPAMPKSGSWPAKPAVTEVNPAVKELKPAVAEVQSAAAEVKPAVAEVQSAAAEIQPAAAEAKPTLAQVKSAIAEVKPAVAAPHPPQPQPSAAGLSAAPAQVAQPVTPTALPAATSPSPPSVPPTLQPVVVTPVGQEALDELDRQPTLPPRSNRWTLEQIAVLLDEQHDRDGLLAVTFSYLSFRLDSIYAFVLKGGGLRSYLAWGLGARPFERLTGLTLQPAERSVVATVLQTRQPYLGLFDRDELLEQVYATIERPLPAEGILVPISLRERAVMLLVADNDQRSIEAAVLPELSAFMPKLSAGLERLILEQKRQPSTHPPEPAASSPGAPPPVKAQSPPPPAARDQDLARTPTPRPDPSSPASPPDRSYPVQLPGQVIELARMTRPSAEYVEDDLHRAETPRPTPQEQLGAAPDAQQAPRQPGPASSSLTTVTELLRQLSHEEATVRERALTELRSKGAEPLDAYLRAFPGPVLVERDSLVAGRYPPIEEHGPVLQLLVAVGAPAVPRLVRELESPVIANRFYAALLIGRLGDASHLEVLINRLYDPVGLVRQAAREALCRFVTHPDFTKVRTRLTTDLIQAEGEATRWAVEAVAWFRDTEAVELLLPLLKHRDILLRETALEALRDITRHDFGTVPKNWKRWYQKFRSRDRLEWLIDALVEEELELREGAASELHRLTGQRIPFDVQGSRKEWKRAQSDWQAWFDRSRKG